MKGFMKRLLSGALCIMMVLLTACGGSDKTAGDSASSGGGEEAAGGGKGRYLETDVALPEGVQTVYCMRKLDDGMIRLVAAEGIFDSADEGKTFEQSKLVYTVKGSLGDSAWLIGVALDGQGRLFVSYSDGVRVVDNDGSEKKLDIELPTTAELGFSEDADFDNYIERMGFTTDGMLLGADLGRTIYLIDPNTGERIRELYKEDKDSNSHMVDFAQVGEHLAVLTITGMDLYSMETGKLEDPETAFSSYFSGQGDNQDMDRYSQIIAADAKGDGLYYGDGTGLYRHVLGAGEMERLINGSLSVMSNPQMYFNSLVQKEDGGFLVLYTSETGPALKDYTYSKDAATVPENELKVYALRDSDAVRQAIAGFQAQNPDYYVSLEVGMSGEDSVTAADAIKTLNTNIMSGKGPDILFTEGLPLEAYIEKGVLADLSDVAEEVKKNNAFFENVLNASKTDAGQFAIPTRFAVPIIAGDPETINAVNDLKTLTDQVTAMRQADKDIKTIIGNFDAKELSDFMLQLSLNEIWDAKGQINETALTSYIDSIKELYKQNGETGDSGEEFVFHMVGEGNYATGNTSIGAKAMSAIENQQKVAVGTIQSLYDYSMLQGVLKEKQWDYKPLNGLSEQVFIPIDTVAVNAKSNEADKAKEFVKYMISEEAQLSSYATGLPVNKDAFSNSYANSKLGATSISVGSADSDGAVSLDLAMGTQEDLDKLLGYLEAATVAPRSNEVVTDAVVSATGECASSQSDTAAAVESILKTVNLYLSE